MISGNLIPAPDNQEKIYHKQGSTEDIIQIVLKGCNADIKKGFKDFCKQFSADEYSLRDLWSFVKYQIEYRTDDDGRQDILLPAALWHRGWGDCKSKTVFTAHVLRCLGIPYTVRFTGFAGKSLTHVYLIAHLHGKDIIIDTVYDFYDREKKYKHKKDYSMTKISMISGLKDIDTERIIKEKQVEISQKREYITPQQDIPLTGTVGEARAYLLKRQLELLRAFNIDNPQKVADYNKSLLAVDTAIVKGPTSFKISGTAYGEIEAQVKNIINTKLKDIRPAMSFNNTYEGKIAKVGALAPTEIDTKSLVVLNNTAACNNVSQLKACYKLGANTPYAVNLDSIRKAVIKYLEENIGKNLTDANGNVIMKPATTGPFGITFPASPIKLVQMTRTFNINIPSDYNSQLQFLNQLKAFPIPNQELQLFQQGLSDANYVLRFGNIDAKSKFEKYIEEQSGLWQKFLNRTVFVEEQGVGCGVLYHYNSNTGIPANKFSSSVNSKKAVQSQWMAAANYLTGADQTIINDMGRNTVIYNLSQNPEDAIKKLAMASGIVPNVSIEPATIIAIVGLVASIVFKIIDAMQKSKRDGDNLAPERTVGFSPLGAPLMPDEEDWEGSGSGSGSGSGDDGTGGGTEGGFDTNTLLALGLLGAGGYFLLNKGKK